MLLHRIVSVGSGASAQMYVRFSSPQRQTRVVRSVHDGHGPSWHLDVHACPHAPMRPQIWSHFGSGSVHLVRPVAGVRPHGHVRTRSGANTHCWRPVRTWHGRVHVWMPQSYSSPHSCPQLHAVGSPGMSRSLQSIVRFSRPQWHGASVSSTVHGGQSPAWHGWSHVCMPHARTRPHVAPHDTAPPIEPRTYVSGLVLASGHWLRSCVQRWGIAFCLPQKHGTGTLAGHGGHGPGWHTPAVHPCHPHARRHGRPHECAFPVPLGIVRRPHQQRYSVGIV